MATPHRFDIRVYYEDTDFSGVVYHASYLRFLERGRTEFLRHLGIDQTMLFAGALGNPLAFAVTRMEIDFRRPARMDDLLRVETRLEALGGASLRMDQRLRCGGELVVSANVKVAALSGGKVARIPAALAAKLAAACPEPEEDAAAAPPLRIS